jgi:tetratricopeptide (TPR) repeat protein
MAGRRQRKKSEQQEFLWSAVQTGIDLHRRGHLPEAERIYSEVLAIDAERVDALQLLAVLKRAQGNPMEAISLLGRALRAAPTSIEVLSDRAGMLIDIGRYEEALEHCDRAVVIDPNHAGAWTNRATALQWLGRLDESLKNFDKAVALKPRGVEAWTNRGNTLEQLGRPEDAVASYGKALAIDDGKATIWINRGLLLQKLGRYAAAVADYDKALALDAANPKNISIWNCRGVALHLTERYDEALVSYDRALAINPDDPDVWSNRGNTLRALGRLDEALANHDRAIAFHPRHAKALSNRANVLLAMGRQPEAVAGYDRALAITPDDAEIINNRAAALARGGCHDEALAEYERVLTLVPDHGDAIANAGMLRLLMGDFRGGWPRYESRWRLNGARPEPLRDAAPQWRGEPEVAGKTILLFCEQGLGDTIQLLRYVPMVAATGARVILGVQAQLKALAAQVAPDALVVSSGETMPKFDLQCPLLSLPFAFGTELDTIPRGVPYLHAPEHRVAEWRSRLPAGGARRVGLVWAGNAAHKNDRNRSLELARLKPLFDMPGVQFLSLQRELRPGDAAILNAHANVTHLGVQLVDFAETAAVIACLDLVITADTAVAHLAGAMGKPVWILLPLSPDWRWLRGRDDSPWYPTAKLFRQETLGDWDSVVARARAELAA